MTDNRATLNLAAIPLVFDHLVAPVRELHALGMSTHAIYERCRPGGPWQRMEPNLVLLTDEPPSRAQLINAALKVAGEDAVLTGVDALKLHGLSGAKLLSPIHVLLPVRRRQPRLVDGVYFDRTHQLPEPLHLKGFPVAPLPRATVDAARRAKVSKHVEDLLAESIYKGKITPATLRDELDRVGGRGLTLPRRKLAEIDDKVRSMARGWARRLVQRSGLPMPEWRVPITSRNGIHVATADAWWDEVGLAWEVDSYAFDLSPVDAQAALSRAARLTASGVLVVHTSPSQLREEPARVADLLRGAYARAMARPRPEVNGQCRPPKPTRQPSLFTGTLPKTPATTPSGKLVLLDPSQKPAPPQPQQTAESTPTEKPADSNPPQKPHENEQSEKTAKPAKPEQPPQGPAPEPTYPTPEQGTLRPTPDPQATEPTPEPRTIEPTPEPETIGPTPEPQATEPTSEPEATEQTPEPKVTGQIPKTGAHNKTPYPDQPQPPPEPLENAAEPGSPDKSSNPDQPSPTPEPGSLHKAHATEPSQPTPASKAHQKIPEPQQTQPTSKPQPLQAPEAVQFRPAPES